MGLVPWQRHDHRLAPRHRRAGRLPAGSELADLDLQPGRAHRRAGGAGPDDRQPGAPGHRRADRRRGHGQQRAQPARHPARPVRAVVLRRGPAAVQGHLHEEPEAAGGPGRPGGRRPLPAVPPAQRAGRVVERPARRRVRAQLVRPLRLGQHRPADIRPVHPQHPGVSRSGTWQSGGMTAPEQAGQAADDAAAVMVPAPETDIPTPATPAGRVREETISRLQQAMGSLGTAAMMSMEQRLPWFRGMSAENRSWIGLVAQAGIAAFVDWVKHPERSRSAVAGEVFGTAPRELARAVSLQQVVEMVRVTIDVVEARVDELAAPGGEAELREAVLHYTREVAFAAARVYARTAEARGAWDARLEALVVDSLVRGDVGEGVHSWASALNWSSAPVAVIVGTAEDDEPEGLIDELRVTARRARLDLLAGVQGNKLVVVLGGSSDPLTAVQQFAGRFGNGPLVVGPVVTDLYAAASSAAAALAGMRAAPAWPDVPRPVLASDLLPERALDGDESARAELIEHIYGPLQRGGAALLDTVTTYLEQGNSLEATARMLFVHPNTVRYRLRRATELTGFNPGSGRGGFVLWLAIVYGRLSRKRTLFVG